MAERYTLYTAQSTTGHKREAIYNALDTIATLEIDNVLEKQMSPEDIRAMNFYLAAQAAALDMTVRGMLVNPVSHKELLGRLAKRKRDLERQLAKHPLIAPIGHDPTLDPSIDAAADANAHQRTTITPPHAGQISSVSKAAGSMYRHPSQTIMGSARRSMIGPSPRGSTVSSTRAKASR